MRLIDRSAEIPVRYQKSVNGRSLKTVPGMFDATMATIRYVLDQPASNACGELLRNGEGLFEADNPLFRMPADSFWVELFEEHAPGYHGPNRRLGYLVQSEPDGRSGVILPFHETNEGLRRQSPCTILFDLDNKMSARPGMHPLRHAEMQHLRDLLDHCLLCPDATGMKELRNRSEKTSSVLAELAQGTWYALPLLVAFTALLNSPQVVEMRNSDLLRLNRERVKRGRAPLLDHVEVRLCLGGAAVVGNQGGPLRTAPRLHVVRGHVVRRNGKTFWRQAHLRGDSQKAIISKTVRVTAGQAVRYDAACYVRSAAQLV
jgi:hypothetical protein